MSEPPLQPNVDSLRLCHIGSKYGLYGDAPHDFVREVLAAFCTCRALGRHSTDGGSERIWKVLGHADKGFLIDTAFVKAVQARIGGGAGWGEEPPGAVCAAVVAVFMERYEVKEQ